MTACPPADVLSELLSDELSDARRQPLEAHVGECGVCQQTLLELAGDWTRWQRLLSADTQTMPPAPGPDALPATVLDRLKAVPFAGPLGANGPAAWPHVPGFDILDELGRGGTAVVYKARQRNLGRLVALKMILTGRHAGADRRVRFRLEAEAVARLHHPNIVQIFETNAHDGLPYCVLELVDGGSLAGRIGGAPQPPLPAAALIQTLASALAVAHQHRIVHRDLKPANILLQDPGAAPGSFGTPKIADFGLALVLDDDSAQTRSGDVIGTPSYMAPEQAQGRRAAIGPATDLYALGAILYELLTGRPPFRAATAVDTLVQVSFDEPVPPTRFQRQVPRDLETICLKCLQKNPARRYASAGDLADDLQRFLRHEPIRARPAGLAERLHKWVRRRPLVAGLLTLVVGVSLLGVAGIAAALVEARAAQHNEAEQRAAAEAATTQAEAALDRAERSVYLGAIHQARSQWQLNNVRAAGQLLDGCDPARRGWAWHYLRNLAHAELLTVAEAAPYVGGLAYSPDGRWLAAAGGTPFAPQHGVIQVLDAETGAVRWRRSDRPFPVWGVAFSPDGRQLAACGGDWMRAGRGELLLYDAATGKVLREFSGQTAGPGRGVAFSPDGRRLASAGIDEIVRVWDAATGDECCRIRCGAGASNVAFSADGQLLLTGAENGVHCWKAADGAPVRRITTEGGLFALAGDGRRLITAGRGGTVRVYDVADVAARPAALVDVLAGHATDILALAFGPDGRQIASAGADSTVRVGTFVGGMDARSVWRGHLGRVGALAFHPDGHRLASGGQQPGDVKIWDITRPAECTIAANFGAAMRDVEALAYTADDRELLVLGLGGILARADSATGAVDVRQRIGTTIAWQVPAVRAAFAAQGRRLLAVSAENPQHVNVWDVAAERITQSFTEHTARIWHVDTDRDGRIVASAGFAVVDGSPTRELKVWDSATGKVCWAETTPQQRTLALALSPDGARFAEAVQTPAGPTVRLDSLAAPTQTPMQLQTGGSAVRALAFSHDGTRLAGATERGAVVVWDATTGQPICDRPLEGMPGIGDLAFSPDGKTLAAVNRDRVQVWDLASGQVLLYLRGAGQRITDNGFNPRLVWSADGTRLAASCWDRTVAVFDAADVTGETGKPRLRLQAANRRFSWHLSQLGKTDDGWSAGAEAFHRRRVQDQEPPTLELRRQRGNYYARLREWDRVLADFTPAPGTSEAEAQETLVERSLLLLQAGDAAGYRRLVEAALAVPRDPRDIECHWRLVRAATLAPLGDSATAQALTVAKHLRHVLPHERTVLDCLGLTLLRAGRLPEAADCFRQSLRTDSRELANIGLALVLLRQGDRAAAQKHLAWIDEWLQAPFNQPPAAGMPCGEQWDWRGWLAIHQLRQEALSQPGPLQPNQ